MDGDGDTDVLAAFIFGAGSIAWYENRLLECGNGLVESGEECDDGGIEPGDGCSETCIVEPGSTCTGEPSVCITGIPAVSDWGLVVMGLLVLVAGTIVTTQQGRAKESATC
jgi:cysteine-rich repeat protein